jgi:hypothetical protein
MPALAMSAPVRIHVYTNADSSPLMVGIVKASALPGGAGWAFDAALGFGGAQVDSG